MELYHNIVSLYFHLLTSQFFAFQFQARIIYGVVLEKHFRTTNDDDDELLSSF
jgi:hypothetical protein